jgi:hypothetical protein
MLNRVFDAIGFMYPDYRYPPRGQKRKSATSEKDAASAAPRDYVEEEKGEGSYSPTAIY